MSFEPDMKAVARIASRVRIADIRLTSMDLKKISESTGGQLTANIERRCVETLSTPERIEVACYFRFKGADAKDDIVNIEATYSLTYMVDGDGPIAPDDVKHFAFANGAYNSWPFARELFHSMTSRMGLPPFVLPVLSFAPPRPSSKPAAIAK